MPSPGPALDVTTAVALFGVGTAVLLLLAVGLILFTTRYQRRLLEQQARARELEADLQRRLLETVLRTQEEERRRIARDLHDDVGTTLSALKMQVYALSMGTDGPDELTPVLDDVIQRVRTISGQLLPATLEKFGLAPALRALAQQLDSLTPGLTIEFVESGSSASGPLASAGRPTELILYRITQELLGNAIKHAHASLIQVELAADPAHLRLEARDNGRGFDYGQARLRPASDQPGGLGLLSLESRVGSIHGQLTISSAPGQGTRAAVVVPQPSGPTAH